MKVRWLRRKAPDTGVEERFYPITHTKAVITENGETVDAMLNKITVTSDIPIHLKITENGILRIVYDDGRSDE